MKQYSNDITKSIVVIFYTAYGYFQAGKILHDNIWYIEMSEDTVSIYLLD